MIISEIVQEYPKHHSVKIDHSTGDYTEYEDRIEVNSVRTPIRHRGQGGAHAVLRHIAAHADGLGKPSRLLASPLDRKTRLDSLVNFYKKHGYELTGTTGNIAGDPWMERKII